jgi:hypothetical protein
MTSTSTLTSAFEVREPDCLARKDIYIHQRHENTNHTGMYTLLSMYSLCSPSCPAFGESIQPPFSYMNHLPTIVVLPSEARPLD